MQKVRIICLDSDKKNAVAALHRLGMLDLRKSSLPLEEETAGQEFSEISDSIMSIEGAMNALGKQKVSKESHPDLNTILQRARNSRKTTEQIYRLLEKKKQIEDDSVISDYAFRVAELFKGMRIDFSKLQGNVLGFKAFVGDSRQISLIESNIKKMKIEHEFVTEALGKKEKLVFIAYEKGKSIEEAVRNVKAEELDLHATYIEGTPAEIMKRIEEARARNTKILAEIAEELKKISSEEYSKLANTKEMLEIENSRMGASAMFKRTEKTLVIEGWVPVKKEEELKKILNHACSGREVVEKINEKKELAPTYLNRPRYSSLSIF